MPHETFPEKLYRESDSSQLMSVSLLSTFKTPSRIGQIQLEEYVNAINVLLESKGYGLFVEPSVLREDIEFRSLINSFPTTWFLQLQRLQGHVIKDSSWKEVAVSEEDSIIDEILESGLHTHLICHATEGFYVPIEIPSSPLFDISGKLPGSWVGSANSLYQELLDLSPVLDIRLRSSKGSKGLRMHGGADLSPEMIEELNKDHINEIKHPFYIERIVWFSLYEACRLSLFHETAIIFV